MVVDGGREYLEKYGVQDKIAEAVSTILRDRPANPIAALGKLLTNPVTVCKYLMRIGYSESDAAALEGRKPSIADLTELVQKHITSVPFENIGQMGCPADGAGIPEVPIRMPSLDVTVSLKKIVMEKRGGYCYEINYCFAWLLRKLGYRVRLSRSDVMTPGGPTPGHLCMLVDGLDPTCALLIDPGFGDAPRVPIPLSVKDKDGAAAAVDDPMTGDTYLLKSTAEFGGRFNMMLMRQRKAGMMGTPMAEMFGVPDMPIEATPPEPVHIFNADDDLSMDCEEFTSGLAGVCSVAEANFFSQKRFCLVCTAQGFRYLGSDYVKEKTLGVEVRRTPITSEAHWRKVASDEFGIHL